MKIAIQNASTVVSEHDVQTAVAAVQRQVTEHFTPAWSIDGALCWIPKGQPVPADHALVVVLDDSDQASVLGFHDLQLNGMPQGKVFAHDDIKAGLSWTVTLSHEVLELLVDPDVNLAAQDSDGSFFSYEVCDAVEDDSLGYRIDGVLVSDFVLPTWFSPSTPTSEATSYRRNVFGPFVLAKGGYIGTWVPNEGWTQVTHSMGTDGSIEQNRGGPVAPRGSRRERRARTPTTP
jgi:hypothetical protein